jgi:xanthine dehydrogenase accessory factor
MSWWSAAAEHIAGGRAVALVTVCTVKGSAPRETGAKMLVWGFRVEDGGQHGTIGGGQLEFTLVEQACKLLAANEPWRFQNYPLGPLLGQCCGGNVGILLERLDRSSLNWLGAVAAMEEAGVPYGIVSRLEGDAIRRQIIAAGANRASVSMRHGEGAGVAGHLGEGSVITEQVLPRPLLLMFGAGHVGEALAPIAATLPFRLAWLDTRAEFAGPGITITADPAGAVAEAPPGSFFLIVTQSHALDYDLTRAVLARGDFAYCGLIGSATKRARFEKRLAGDGIAAAAIARLTCPIGEIGLQSKLPEAIAVAVAAELLLVLERSARSALAPSRTIHAT